jgi:hypothetical protein
VDFKEKLLYIDNQDYIRINFKETDIAFRKRVLKELFDDIVVEVINSLILVKYNLKLLDIDRCNPVSALSYYICCFNLLEGNLS